MNLHIDRTGKKARGVQARIQELVKNDRKKKTYKIGRVKFKKHDDKDHRMEHIKRLESGLVSGMRLYKETAIDKEIRRIDKLNG